MDVYEFKDEIHVLIDGGIPLLLPPAKVLPSNHLPCISSWRKQPRGGVSQVARSQTLTATWSSSRNGASNSTDQPHRHQAKDAPRQAREATRTMHCFLPFLSPLLPSVAFICLHPVSRLCLQRVHSSFTTLLLSQSNICHFSDNGQRGAHRLRGGGPSYHHWS